MHKTKYLFSIITSLLLFFLFAPLPLSAQESDSIGNSHYFVIDANTFFYDVEYATPLAKGYTVTGFRLSPSYVYDIALRAQLRIGFNATVFAGLDSLYQLRPVLSICYAPTLWLTLVGGTIDSDHDLPEPLYDRSYDYFHYQEDGLQILTNTRIWHSDTWLDWSHYLTPWTADQEEFTVGTHHTLNLFQNSKFRIQSSLLSMAHHRGGELKTIDTNTVTTFNHRIALDFAYKMKAIRLSLNMPVYFYHLEDNNLDGPGYAFHPTLSFQHTFASKYNSKISANIGFWYGDHFFSSQGAPQFWSVNNYTLQHITPSNNLGIVPDTRQLVTFGVAFQHDFNALSLQIAANFYHDLDLNKTDLNVAFAMNIYLVKNKLQSK